MSDSAIMPDWVRERLPMDFPREEGESVDQCLQRRFLTNLQIVLSAAREALDREDRVRVQEALDSFDVLIDEQRP